jgi:hypothetical protein
VIEKKDEAIIDELDARLGIFTDKSEWNKTNMADWYPWLIEEGPRIVQTWREMMGILSLLPENEFSKYLEKWDKTLDLIDNDETFRLALKYKRKNQSSSNV